MLDKLKNLLTHPTVEVAFIQAVLSYAISQGLFDLTPEQTGVVMAVVTGLTGLVAALLTNAAWLVWVLNLAKGLAALIVAFDFHFNTARTAAYIGVIVFALGLVEHSKASPKYGPLADARADAAAPLPFLQGGAALELTSIPGHVYSVSAGGEPLTAPVDPTAGLEPETVDAHALS